MGKFFETDVDYDLIGVGFGPSNIALAISLEEKSLSRGGINALFLDKQKNYSWHGNTLQGNRMNVF